MNFNDTVMKKQTHVLSVRRPDPVFIIIYLAILIIFLLTFFLSGSPKSVRGKNEIHYRSSEIIPDFDGPFTR